jgi:hypothetical protein
MPLNITRHRLATQTSVPLEPERNQEFRTHPERNATGYDNALAPLKGRVQMSGGSIRPSRATIPPPGPRTAVIEENAIAKLAGYSQGPFATTTGTSRKGMLCATDSMGVCSAVVLGGEPRVPAAAVVQEPKAKVRVFHAYPLNHQAPQQISDSIVKMWGQGLIVSAAMRGGLQGTAPERVASQHMVNTLKQTLQNHLVPIVYDDTLTRSTLAEATDKPIGGIIEGNRIRFVDEVRVIGADGPPNLDP